MPMPLTNPTTLTVAADSCPVRVTFRPSQERISVTYADSSAHVDLYLTIADIDQLMAALAMFRRTLIAHANEV